MSKIPEGATHTFNSVTLEYKKLRPGSYSMWLTYVDGDWIVALNATPHMYMPIIEEWSGKGLPPVGLVCEHSCDDNKTDSENGRWKEVKIVGHHQFQNDEYLCAVWVSGVEVSYSSEGEHFRPIRTSEQIAAEKRDAAIKMIEARVNVVRLVAERIYDAGLRFEGMEK